MNLYLKEPTIKDKEEIIKMCKEFENSDDEYKFEGTSNIKYVLSDSYKKYLERCEADKNIESINPNWSNATNYLLVDENNHIYGCSQFRHHILGELVNVGGNFAYAIRPSERGKGYGTIQLKLLIEKAKEFGLEKVLVTCRENNIGSKKTMEKFIGEADTLVPSIHDGIMEYRYWINVDESIEKNQDKYEPFICNINEKKRVI